MTKLLNGRRTLLLSLLAVFVSSTDAQTPQSKKSGNDLFRTIADLDAALFDSYNRCDLEKFKSFFTNDVEFYHDQGGLTVGSQTVTEQVKKNICGVARRELIPETLKVYPMHGFGAVQMGSHHFYQIKVSESKPSGEAKFIHLWQNKDGAWKITRVISYDHVALAK